MTPDVGRGRPRRAHLAGDGAGVYGCVTVRASREYWVRGGARPRRRAGRAARCRPAAIVTGRGSGRGDAHLRNGGIVLLLARRALVVPGGDSAVDVICTVLAIAFAAGLVLLRRSGCTWRTRQSLFMLEDEVAGHPRRLVRRSSRSRSSARPLWDGRPGRARLARADRRRRYGCVTPPTARRTSPRARRHRAASRIRTSARKSAPSRVDPRARPGDPLPMPCLRRADGQAAVELVALLPLAVLLLAGAWQLALAGHAPGRRTPPRARPPAPRPSAAMPARPRARRAARRAAPRRGRARPRRRRRRGHVGVPPVLGLPVLGHASGRAHFRPQR